jgi:hypothetical protein
VAFHRGLWRQSLGAYLAAVVAVTLARGLSLAWPPSGFLGIRELGVSLLTSAPFGLVFGVPFVVTFLLMIGLTSTLKLHSSESLLLRRNILVAIGVSVIFALGAELVLEGRISFGLSTVLYLLSGISAGITYVLIARHRLD